MDRIADALLEQRGEQGLIDWINSIDHTAKENDMLSYKTHAIRQSVERIARNDREKAIQFIGQLSLIKPSLTIISPLEIIFTPCKVEFSITSIFPAEFIVSSFLNMPIVALIFQTD